MFSLISPLRRGPALTAALLVALVSLPAAAQSQPDQRQQWKVPRTVDGHPDLQGVWGHNVITPLERPLELKGRERLTPEEAGNLKRRAAELFSGDGDAAFTDSIFVAALGSANEFKSTDAGTGNYNHFWLGERTFDDRTSLITDPPDGRIPALTPQAQARQQAAAERRKTHPADGPEDRGLNERCITYGLPNVLAGYNSNVQIVQSRDYVVLVHEMIHDARVIPLDGRPHVPKVRHILGDSRGRWEGDTLVIETKNFAANAFGLLAPGGAGSSEKLHLIERLTRVSDDTLHYEFTVNDPETWTNPWSALLPWNKVNGLVYEYACHEGNVGMEGILAGHRAQEAKAASAAATKR